MAPILLPLAFAGLFGAQLGGQYISEPLNRRRRSRAFGRLASKSADTRARLRTLEDESTEMESLSQALDALEEGQSKASKISLLPTQDQAFLGELASRHRQRLGEIRMAEVPGFNDVMASFGTSLLGPEG